MKEALKNITKEKVSTGIGIAGFLLMLSKFLGYDVAELVGVSESDATYLLSITLQSFFLLIGKDHNAITVQSFFLLLAKSPKAIKKALLNLFKKRKTV